jgi:anti-sigma factor RsiW
MTCNEAYLRICDNLDADPNSAKCRQVLKHLETCPDCAAFLDSVKKTIALYKMLPNPRTPATAHQRLMKAINRAWESPKPTHRKAAR